MTTIVESIKAQALRELDETERERLVAIEKEKIMAHRGKPIHLFPWRIRIINLNKE